MYLESKENNPLAPYDKQIDIKDRKKLVAKLIQSVRKAKGYLQKDVAEILGIPLTTYSGYEIAKTETPVEILVRLSYLYDVPIDYLVGRDMFSVDFGEQADNQIEDMKKALDDIRRQIKEGKMQNNERAQIFADSFLQSMQDLAKLMKESNDIQTKIYNSKNKKD